MKKITLPIILLAFFLITPTAVIGQANTSLSNLTSTSINQSLVPNSNNSINLGSSGKSWRNIYTKGSIYVDGSRFINKSGTGNTFVGASSGLSNTTGYFNSAVGFHALYLNTSGVNNTADGYGALAANTTGYENTAMGSGALEHNKTGGSNVAIGVLSMALNTAGSSNTAIGEWSLYSNNGFGNAALGVQALFHNTTGNSNTAVGNGALYSNITGYANVAIGNSALSNAEDNNNNVAIGDSAFLQLYSGNQSVAVGSKAGHAVTNGSSNSYFGWNAGYADNASDNTAIGRQAGWIVANGSRCTYLGSQAGPTTAGLTNSMGIGYNATPTASNQVRIGNDNVNSIGGKVGWTTFSDGRFKRNIKESVPGLTFINLLKPVTYMLDIAAIKKFKGEDAKEHTTGANQSMDNDGDRYLHTGFLAQDVESAAKKLGYDFDGVDAPKNGNDVYGLRYAAFVVPLVKAVQELSQQNNDLQKQVNELKSMLTVLTQKDNGAQGTGNTGLASALIEQNIPNPFTSATTISYVLPQKFTRAALILTDNTGKTIKLFDISGAGKGVIQLDAATLASGIYQYSLVMDGQVAGTRQMILAKSRVQ